MTEKTMLQKIRSLAHAAMNSDDDQKQFGILMRIIELTETDNTPFAVGEYYFDKDVNRIVKIEHHETSYTEIKYLSDGKLQNSVLYNLADYFDKWTPATAGQIKMFKVAEAIERSGLTPEQHKQMISDGKINIGVWSALQTTAEELQEVGES